MNRLFFLKKLLTLGTASSVSFPMQSVVKSNKEEFSFNDLFVVHDKNDRLIYPKKDSVFYKRFELLLKDNLDLKLHPTYLGIHELFFTIKEKYTFEDFLSLKYFIEERAINRKYTKDPTYQTCFRFIKERPDRMYLEMLLAHRY